MPTAYIAFREQENVVQNKILRYNLNNDIRHSSIRKCRTKLRKICNIVLNKTAHVSFQLNGAVDQVVIDAEGIGLGLVDVSTWLFTHHGIKGTMSVVSTKTDSDFENRVSYTVKIVTVHTYCAYKRTQI